MKDYNCTGEVLRGNELVWETDVNGTYRLFHPDLVGTIGKKFDFKFTDYIATPEVTISTDAAEESLLFNPLSKSKKREWKK